MSGQGHDHVKKHFKDEFGEKRESKDCMKLNSKGSHGSYTRLNNLILSEFFYLKFVLHGKIKVTGHWEWKTEEPFSSP